MNNGQIIKAYEVTKTLKGSDILALGADTIIVKQKPADISINPSSGSEFISYTYNDEIKVTSTDTFLFKEPTKIALVKTEDNYAFADVSFAVKSTETLVVTDIATPVNLTSLSQVDGIRGFEIDVTTASLKNISGRDVVVEGQMAIQITQTGGQPCTLYVNSEISSDGATWTPITESLRSLYVSKSGVDFFSIPSVVPIPWMNGDYIRWVFSKSGTGGVTIAPVTQTIGGTSITGRSFIWGMRERIR